MTAKLTNRVCKKRGSKRFMAYKIPRACALRDGAVAAEPHMPCISNGRVVSGLVPQAYSVGK